MSEREAPPRGESRLISDEPKSARRRRGGGASAGRVKGALEQSPWKQPVYLDAPFGPLTEEGVHAVHDAAMRVLEEVGIEFLNDEARAILKAAGCAVNGENVRMDRCFVMEQINKAPERFDMVPRNPARKITIGGGYLAVGQVGSPPSVHDLDRGRRNGNAEDCWNLMRLSQHFNCIHFVSGWPVEPIDIHPKTRYLIGTAKKLTLTDKVIHAYSLGAERVEDALELQRIASGVSHEDFAKQPRIFTNINSTSPLKHDHPMLDGAMRFARRGQPVVIAPFTLAGAMAPITLAGAVAQQTAECLAAMVLLQIINPGTPVVFGAFTTNVDMRSGAPAFGTPEYMRAMQMSGQMARFYRLPWRGSNANAANFPDAQAAWESVFSLWGVITGGCNMVYHGAGWLEGGLQASFEKFIIDCEILQNIFHYLEPIGVTEEDLAVDVIKEVGPQGHFFGTAHTQARYETQFYKPFLSDWRNHGGWVEAGEPKAHDHANRLWKQALSEYEEPPMDPAIREEIDAYVARRIAEGGVPTDF